MSFSEKPGFEFVDQSHSFEKAVNALYKIRDVVLATGLDSVITQDAELSNFLEHAHETASETWEKSSFTEVKNFSTANKEVTLNFGFDIEEVEDNLLQPEARLSMSVEMDKGSVEEFLNLTVLFNGLNAQWAVYYNPGLADRMLPEIKRIIETHSVNEGKISIPEQSALKLIKSICEVFKQYIEFGKEDLD